LLTIRELAAINAFTSAAEEFLRLLYRERRLGDAELSGRFRALDDLAAGKLKPPVEPTTQGAK
jgi:hypothetical protein